MHMPNSNPSRSFPRKKAGQTLGTPDKIPEAQLTGLTG